MNVRATGREGTVGLEFGILIPAFLLLVLGLIDVSRLIWTQVSLEHAVEAGARCAAVDETACATAAQARAYAATQAYGMTVPAAEFAAADAACGASVSVSHPVDLVTPWIGTRRLTLTAAACMPKPPA